MPAIPTTLQTMADAWKALGAHIGLATGNPGLTSTPANEVSGGSYARVATSWTSNTGGSVSGAAVTINAPGSTAITYAFLASASTGNNQISNTSITSTTLPANGQIVVTPSLSVA